MTKKVISIDTIVLFLASLSVIKLIPSELKIISYPLVLILLGIYLLIDVVTDKEKDNSVNSFKYKMAIILLIIFIEAVVPCVYRINARHNGKPYEFSHDGGVIHVEEAMKYFIDGKNPYSEDYYNTVLDEYYTINKLDEIKNSLIHHYTYLPFSFLFPLPVYVLSKEMIGWFDMRFIYLVMFIITLFILPKLTENYKNKILILILFSLNPFLTYFLAEGRNEIFILFWIVLSLYFLLKNSFKIASALLAFACCSKLTACFLIPFFALYIFEKSKEFKNLQSRAFYLLKEACPFILILLIFITPFLLWDFYSFKEDIFSWDESYPMGGTPGFGFSNILLYAGYSKGDYFPFKYIQLLIGISLIFFLLKKQQKNNSVNLMLINYGILTFILLYFSRFLHDNYIGYVFSILCLGFCIGRKSEN